MARVLIAGVGDVCFGDDGFGVAVANALSTRGLPPELAVEAFGVRGLHLAQALRTPTRLLVISEVAARGGTPGTLYLFDPLTSPRSAERAAIDLPLVLAAVRASGSLLPRVQVIGCEPADVGARVGLSAPVRRAVEPAVELALRLVERELAAP